MSRRSLGSDRESSERFAAADLPVRDCVELAAGLASYAQRHGLAHVEVSGPPALGDLIEEFGLDQVRFVDAHQGPA